MSNPIEAGALSVKYPQYPIMQFFGYCHLPAGTMRETSKLFCQLAIAVADSNEIPNAEVSTCLRKLLEAKDAAVRAALLRISDAAR